MRGVNDNQIAGPLSNQALTPAQFPLVVDLDRTLVKTDLLIESLLCLVRKSPFYVLVLPFWLLRGKAFFKREIARRVSVNVAMLPWRNEFVEYLKTQRSEGRSLVLASGSDRAITQKVADHLKLFDLVLATEPGLNLGGETKRTLLVSRFGERGFDYAGDGSGLARDDVAVWRSARKAILVNPPHGVREKAARVAEIECVFTEEPASAALLLKVLRPAHWLKNLLVFVPLFAAHQFHDLVLLEKSVLAFVALSLCASGG